MFISLADVVIEDLRYEVIQTGIIVGLFNTLNNSNENARDAAIESILVLARHGTLVLLAPVGENFLIQFQMTFGLLFRELTFSLQL